MTDRFQDLLCDQLISRRVRTVLTPIRLPYFDLAKGLVRTSADETPGRPFLIFPG